MQTQKNQAEKIELVTEATNNDTQFESANIESRKNTIFESKSEEIPISDEEKLEKKINKIFRNTIISIIVYLLIFASLLKFAPIIAFGAILMYLSLLGVTTIVLVPFVILGWVLIAFLAILILLIPFFSIRNIYKIAKLFKQNILAEKIKKKCTTILILNGLILLGAFTIILLIITT